jgi:U2 small nuclear ribonucleoprotein A'
LRARHSKYFQERKAGKALFLTAEGVPNTLATTLSTTVSSNAGKAVLTIDEPKAVPIPGKAGRLMSKEDQERVKAAIAKATSMEEIRRLERSLREGYLPEMESVGA